MTDVSERLSEIRERVEAATEGPWGVYRCTFADEAPEAACGVTSPPLDSYGGDVFQDASRDECHHVIARDDAEFIASARSDVPYLLSLVEEVGEALAEFSIDHMDEEVLAPLEQAGRPDLATVLAQVRDAALKRKYDTALRDAAQEGAECTCEPPRVHTASDMDDGIARAAEAEARECPVHGEDL